ncbi:pyridoxamine 5'-phosphate oxidase family protein [Litoreibacter roseus]|uniref:Pyridoxamine 5'-phosphate oxidase-related FMN-binding protein n=1 Tax=Litoreibacter roseus TaxID=2601869 RepID=A0A6N6JMG3_9RHOB|nr:pyridoxamine 5'-phosphate oxidase family protein [Litoreibacter roseus]GFE66382.1 pyridoxamine 5'-phosphate oxidase-related FMN-binding protein [Litoreibacter roseus]
MTHYIEDIAALEALYGTPGEASLVKVAARMTPLYRDWIMASKLCVLTTVGPDGTDGSPRGDDGPVVLELNPQTLAMPDWRGNNRMDSLRNIVADGRLSLMFIVAGSNNVVRVNGTGRVSVDPDLIAKFERKGQMPRSVIVIQISEIYTQCARALLRSGIWQWDGQNPELPTVGDILKEMTSGSFDGETYDAEWAGRASKTMW